MSVRQPFEELRVTLEQSVGNVRKEGNDVLGNHGGAVSVGVDDVAGVERSPPTSTDPGDVGQFDVVVRKRGTVGQDEQSCGLDGNDVSYFAIGHDPDAADGSSELGRRLVPDAAGIACCVVNHRNDGTWRAGQKSRMSAEIAPRPGGDRAERCRHCSSDRRRSMTKMAQRSVGHERNMANRLGDRTHNGRCRVTAQSVKLVGEPRRRSRELCQRPAHGKVLEPSVARNHTVCKRSSPSANGTSSGGHPPEISLDKRSPVRPLRCRIVSVCEGSRSRCCDRERRRGSGRWRQVPKVRSRRSATKPSAPSSARAASNLSASAPTGWRS